MSTNTVVYVRVNQNALASTETAEENIAFQRTLCHVLARIRGLTVVTEYHETTGPLPTAERPQLRRMLRELPEKQARYVIVADLTRLTRNVSHLIAIEDRIEQQGAKLLVYGEGPAHAALRRRMTAAIAGHEHDAALTWLHGFTHR